MKYYLSTISDIVYQWAEATQTASTSYQHITGPLAKEHGFGLELAEFCVSSNCENKEVILPFFEENASNYTQDLICHGPFNELFPHAIDPAVVTVAWNRYEEAYTISEAYGCTKMVVHGNYVPSLYYPDWFIDRQVSFWKRFLDEHPGKGILCLENVMEPEPELITKIIKEVNSPRLRMCLDIGHANLRPGSNMEWLEACAPYLSHLHIHNNNGPVEGRASQGDLHRGLGNGKINMEAFLKKADELVPSGLTATIESAELTESILWLKEHQFI